MMSFDFNAEVSPEPSPTLRYPILFVLPEAVGSWFQLPSLIWMRAMPTYDHPRTNSSHAGLGCPTCCFALILPQRFSNVELDWAFGLFLAAAATCQKRSIPKRNFHVKQHWTLVIIFSDVCSNYQTAVRLFVLPGDRGGRQS